MYLLIVFLILGMSGSALAQDSLNISKLGCYNTLGSCVSVAVSGNYAYVADGTSGLRVINVANPLAPTEVGFIDTPDNAQWVTVSGNYAFVADGSSGLRIYVIAVPNVPALAGVYDTPGYAYGVAVSGNFAFVADQGSGLRIINISNPSAPTLAGFVDTPDQARGVAVSGNYAYVADNFGGMRIYDVSNPASPTLTGVYAMSNVYGVAVSGNYAYVAGHMQGLRIIDVTNPASPVLAGSIVIGDAAQSVVVRGHYAYIAHNNDCLRVVDVSNPAAPAQVAYYNTQGGLAYGVAVVGSYAYVADGMLGLGVFDISYLTVGLQIQYPDRGVSLHVLTTDTIRWSSPVSGGSVSISINRRYPLDVWEVITSSTENDGSYAWFVQEPVSDSCRFRICMSDTSCDVSNGNSSIMSPHGYLALVKSGQPNSPLAFWDAGVVDCDPTASEWFRFKNLGNESIAVNQAMEPASADFSRTTNCGEPFALAPNQLSACSLQIVFDPAADGEFSDVLQVQADAVNGVGGYVDFPLFGEQSSEPAPPHLVIRLQGEDTHLHWSEADTSVGGCPVSVDRYLVFYSPIEAGPFYYHGWTADTTYTHAGVVTYAPTQFYKVVATNLPATVLADLREGAEMGEVLLKTRNAELELRKAAR